MNTFFTLGGWILALDYPGPLVSGTATLALVAFIGFGGVWMYHARNKLATQYTRDDIIAEAKEREMEENEKLQKGK